MTMMMIVMMLGNHCFGGNCSSYKMWLRRASTGYRDVDEYQDRSFGKKILYDFVFFMSWFYNVVVYSPRERLMERSELKSVLRALAKVFQIIIVIIIIIIIVIINVNFQDFLGKTIKPLLKVFQINIIIVNFNFQYFWAQ